MENKEKLKMEKRMTLGSLFDGSGSFPLSGMLAGIEPVWSSEIEPYPIRVTTKRLPQVKHYGDVSVLNGADLPPVDIITFGSPCQDLSIAGKRAGIHDGARSNLFFEAVRIIKEMREATDGKYPRYATWENVPGALSSNNGEDFRCVLEELCKVKEAEVSVPFPGYKWSYAGEILGDGYSIAWRVLDAQYWGVPQRRARIYLVADFAGGSAPQVLFNGESVPGYSPTRFKTWQGAAGDTEEGAGEAGGSDGGVEAVAADGYNGTVSDMAATLRVNCGDSTGSSAVCLMDQGGSVMEVEEEKTGTLRAETHGHPPVVVDSDPVTAGFCTEHSADSRGIGYEEEVSPTLRAGVVPAALKPEEPISLENHPNDSRVKIIEDGKVQTLSGRMGTGGGNVPLLMEDPGKPVTLKIRQGREGGGKGPLLTKDLSATLGTHNDQTLFEPVDEAEEQTAFGISSFESHAMLSDNPHAGIYEAKTSRTLDVGGGNPSCNQGGICIVAHKADYDVRFTSDGSRVRRSHVYETDTARTLSTDQQDPSGNQGGVAIVEEAVGFDRYNGSVTGNAAHTLDTGGGDTVPMVFEPGAASRVGGHVYEDGKAGTVRANAGDNMQSVCYAIEGNGTRPSHKGDGYSESDKMYTLNATEQHAIAFADKAATLSANDGPKGPSSQMLGNPEDNFVAEERAETPAYGIDRVAFNSGKNANFNFSVQEEVEPTMVSRGPNAVGQPIYHSSKNSYHTNFSDGKAVDTLVASDFKDPPTVSVFHSNHASGMNADFSESECLRTLAACDYKDPPTVCGEPYYIVRRLTPTECARLQGLPDWWAEDLGTEDPTEEDLVFWREVFETHRKVVTGASKPKTDKQIIKWLKDPQSDSAQYKMYGNGIAIPCAYYVLSGIVYYAQETG